MIYISLNQYHIPLRRNCLASISKTVSRFFLGFFLLFFVFTPTEFTITELCDDNAGHFRLGANILLLDV